MDFSGCSIIVAGKFVTIVSIIITATDIIRIGRLNLVVKTEMFRIIIARFVRWNFTCYCIILVSFLCHSCVICTILFSRWIVG